MYACFPWSSRTPAAGRPQAGHRPAADTRTRIRTYARVHKHVHVIPVTTLQRLEWGFCGRRLGSKLETPWKKVGDVLGALPNEALWQL